VIAHFIRDSYHTRSKPKQIITLKGQVEGIVDYLKEKMVLKKRSYHALNPPFFHFKCCESKSL